MDKDFGICGRGKEIKTILNFITEHVDNNKAGVLYLTGPPGTGKTMSINLVLDRIKDVAKLRLNCFKAQSAKVILSKLCESLDVRLTARTCESSMINLLSKKLTGRTCKPFLLVLDEMDQLPKSNNTDFFRTMFSWTQQSFSKLIIIGIANTVNLTARCQAFASLSGSVDRTVEKIIFKPYTSNDIKDILNWYLENDENFEDAAVDAKVIELISKRVAREKGDIRTAIDYFRDTIYDYQNEQRKKEGNIKEQPYPTPPSTPPPTPCKEKTNLSSAVRSAKKRQRESHYFEDKAPPAPAVLLECLMQLCSSSDDSCVDLRTLYGKARDSLKKYGTEASQVDIKSCLEQLESLSIISLKKKRGLNGMNAYKIMLTASESEISRRIQHKQILL